MTDRPDLQKRYQYWLEATREGTEGPWTEKRRLASAMRRVIQGLIETDAPQEELSAAADALEAFGDRLEGLPLRDNYEGWAETSPSGNPLAPPIRLDADPENQRAFGYANFGSPYEGPPGCLHGGWVAASFDEVLGFVNSLTGNPGMTARLTVNYRNPTPLYTDLRFEAFIDRVEGRKTLTHCHLYAGDQLTAEAEGLFVSVDREKFLDWIRKRRGATD